MFRYEKLADLCFLCGCLYHMEKACKLYHHDALRYYRPWLRANGQHPTSLNEIAGELNWLNARKLNPSADSLQ